MFRTCRSLQTGLILLALGGCSKEPPTPTPPSTSLVTAPAPAPQPAAPADIVRSHINAAGIDATYEATFGAQQQLRIAEQRADSRNGEYEFRGARLLHYSGSGLASAEPIELEFDLQGVLTRSKAGSGPVTPAEISAIRQRAQLLRSHALAQKTRRDHH